MEVVILAHRLSVDLCPKEAAVATISGVHQPSSPDKRTVMLELWPCHDVRGFGYSKFSIRLHLFALQEPLNYVKYIIRLCYGVIIYSTASLHPSLHNETGGDHKTTVFVGDGLGRMR